MKHSLIVLSVLTVVIASALAARPASAQNGDADCDDAYVSTSTAQFPGGVPVYPRTAYGVNAANTSIDAFLELVGSTVDIDGLHVISLTEALFSVAEAAAIPAGNGPIVLHAGKVYHADLAGGSPMIVEDPSWTALGLSLNNVNALYFGGDCFEFSPDSIQFLSPIGMIKPWQVFRACAGSPPVLVFDAGNLALNVDSLHHAGDQLEFSFRGNRFLWGGYIFWNQNTYRCSPTGAPKTCAPGSVSPGFDGVGLGFSNLNAYSGLRCGVGPALCADILTDMDVWGEQARGVDLRAWTDSTLHYIGCPGNGCDPPEFYCIDDPEAETLAFGTTVNSALRAMVDPGDAFGDTMPTGCSGCCNGPLGLCNAPDSINNGFPFDMAKALCNALGYADGTVVREVNSNFCPEADVRSVDGLDWNSDFADSYGFGAEYLCTGYD